jgi:hypothetical protein
MPRVTKRALQQQQAQPAAQPPAHPGQPGDEEDEASQRKPGYRPRREHTGAAADAHVEVTLSPEEIVLANAIV